MNRFKSYFLSIILLLLSVKLNSQLEHSFLSENNVWQHKCDSNKGSWGYDEYFTFLADTLINGMECKVVETPYSDKFIMSEHDSKVFIKRHEFLNQMNLMYDFNLEVNDTFTYNYWVYQTDSFETGKMIVDQVDSVQTLSGEYRKRIKLYHIGEQIGSFCSFDAEWVDGIGDLNNHALYLISDCFESSCRVECFYENNQYVYGQCGPDQTNSIDKTSATKIYPNPFINKIFIKSDQMPIIVTLYNSSGQIVLDEPLFDREIQFPSDLKSGLYLLKLQYEDGSVGMKKVMRECCH